MVSVQDLHKKFGKNKVLTGLDLEMVKVVFLPYRAKRLCKPH